jgi:choline/glycine/proline betaine transport protein
MSASALPPGQDRAPASATGPVFLVSALLILVLVLTSAVAPQGFESVANAVQAWVLDRLGWFYMLSVAVFLIFALYLAASSHGRVKLGPDHAEPEFRRSAWYAMLFSAGMGIGLVFFGVAEPVTHFTKPPVGEGGTVEAAREAMRLAFFHWGIHAWAIYAVVGLSLAYFSFRHGLPLTIRSALYPLIGSRIEGPLGHAVDVFAVLGTIFGVATSLGLGVLQINAGLAHLAGLPESLGVQVVLLALITAMATVSVALGLDAGIRRLSEFNMLLAAVLLVFVAVTGPTVFLLRALVQNTGAYLDDLLPRTFMLYAYEPTQWIESWTLFYWAWWISWSPFVGMFIARISRGRTIREFVLGVLFVPTGFTLAWLTVFGNTALWLQLSGATTAVTETVAQSVPLALFTFLEQLPIATLSSALATLLVVTFFVTSADSAALVVDTITAGGSPDAPAWRRVFWAVLAGVVAAALLFAGGLQALQTATIASALPFTAIMLLICWGLFRALRLEQMRAALPAAPRPVVFQPVGAGAGSGAGAGAGTGAGGWQRRLQAILHHPTRAEAEAFLASTAAPALQAVAEELRRRGVAAELAQETDRLRLLAAPGTPGEFRYAVRLRSYAPTTFAWTETRPPPETARSWRAEVFLREGGQDYDVLGLTRDQLIADVLGQYERHLGFLALVGRAA